MIKNLINKTTQTTIGAAIILGAASFVSRLIGIVRDRIFAHEFGAGDILDAYYAAFRIPDLVYNLLVVGALSAGFIPVFMKLIGRRKKEAWKVTSAVINTLGLFLVIVSGILLIFTPQLTALIVPGFEGEKLQTTIQLTRIMFLSPLLLGLSSVVSGVLQSFKSFFIYALTPIMYNVGIIFGAVALVPYLGPIGLAYGVVFGALLHLLIQIPTFIKHGFTYSPVFLWSNKHVREIVRLMIPRTLGLATVQGNLIVMTLIASTIGVGSVAVFNFATNIQYFPIGIIGISFAVAAFPTLSKLVADKKVDKMAEHLSITIREVLFFIIPLSIIFLLLRAQIVRILLGSGAFGWEATVMTADTLAFFTLSLFAQSLIPLIARGFYAIRDTWTPFVTGVVGSLVNIGLALMLRESLGVPGLALAFSAGATVQLFLLWILLRVQLKSIGELKILQSLYKMSLAAVFMAAGIQSLKEPLAELFGTETFLGVLTQAGISAIVGCFLYAFVCYILKVEEMVKFKQSFQKRFLKLKHVQGEIHEADEF